MMSLVLLHGSHPAAIDPVDPPANRIWHAKAWEVEFSIDHFAPQPAAVQAFVVWRNEWVGSFYDWLAIWNRWDAPHFFEVARYGYGPRHGYAPRVWGPRQNFRYGHRGSGDVSGIAFAIGKRTV